MKTNCSTGESPARDAIDEAPRLRLRRSMGAWDRLGLGPELPPASDTKKEDDGAATAPPTDAFGGGRAPGTPSTQKWEPPS